MRTVLFSLLLLGAACPFETSAAPDADSRRFVAVDVYLETAEAVAAWQFEFSSPNGRIVGIENGESAAFEGTPYYDREAVQLGTTDRIVVADFSLAGPGELPSGRIRIATLHLVLQGVAEPEFELDLVTAVTHDGTTINASIGLEPRRGKKQ